MTNTHWFDLSFYFQSYLVSKRSAAGGIAFSAQLSVQQTHVPIGTVIKFDKVFVNDGSGYDSQTGVFIAPEKGVSLHLRKSVIMSIFKNRWYS